MGGQRDVGNSTDERAVERPMDEQDVVDAVDEDVVDENAVDDAVDEGHVGAVGVLPILGENWWEIGPRGAFAIILGVMAVGWPDFAPDLGPRLLAVLFASYLFVDASPRSSAPRTADDGGR